MVEPVTMTPRRDDKEVAAEHRALLEEKLKELCVLMDECDESGFAASFQLGYQTYSTGTGAPRKKNIINALTLAKFY